MCPTLFPTISSIQGVLFKNIGRVLWKAAPVLLDYLVRTQKLQGLRVLELGAGCGLPGIGLAKLGADVTLTDVAHVIPLLRYNCYKNNVNAKVQELDWEDHKAVDALARQADWVDLVIASDVVFDVEQAKYFLRVLSTLQTDTLLALQPRDRYVALFLKEAERVCNISLLEKAGRIEVHALDF